MGTVSPTQSNPGETIEAADINTPVNQLAAVINGSIEAVNIASSAVTTAKIADDAVTAGKIDWASTGANAGIWWEEIGRTTLSVAGDTITVNNLPARKYLKIIISLLPSGAIAPEMTFNNDTGSNYSRRQAVNGAADSTGTSGTRVISISGGAVPFYCEFNVVNIATQEKILWGWNLTNGASGAGSAPDRGERFGKWANTSDAISRVDVTNAGAGDFAIGSEVVILGHN